MIVLIVDDSESDRLLASRILSAENPELEIVHAESCEKAVQIIQSVDTVGIDCVVMDQRLVGGSGTHCIRKIRGDGYRGAFVLLTGYTSVSIAAEAMRHGADDFVDKSEAQKELYPAIMAALERRAESVRTTLEQQRTQKDLAAVMARLSEAEDRIARLQEDALNQRRRSTDVHEGDPRLGQ